MMKGSRFRLKTLFLLVLSIMLILSAYTYVCQQDKNQNSVVLITGRRGRILKFHLKRSRDIDSSNSKTTVRLRNKVTIVSAFWDIGSFQKGQHLNHTPKHYEEWASVFQFMLNPLIIYTDSNTFKDLMEKYRHDHKNYTKIILVKRNAFWPFRLTKQIQSVFDQPEYPAYYPNTVNAEYCAIQHAKYAVVSESIKSNIFKTEFYAWLDVGYFRDIIEDERYFILNPPPDQDKNLISMNEVFHPNLSITPDQIFKDNIVWVGGGIVIGTSAVFLKFEKLYKRAVLYFLERKLMNSDQQVLYSIYSDEGRIELRPNVELRLYKPHDMENVGNGNSWFYLGYLCRQVRENISKNISLSNIIES